MNVSVNVYSQVLAGTRVVAKGASPWYKRWFEPSSYREIGVLREGPNTPAQFETGGVWQGTAGMFVWTQDDKNPSRSITDSQPHAPPILSDTVAIDGSSAWCP